MNKETAEKIKGIQDKQNALIAANMPKFGRGIIEAAVDRDNEVWKELSVVFKKFKIIPSISSKIVSENQVPKDGSTTKPILLCPGLKVNIEFIITPVDEEGKSGQFKPEVIVEIGKMDVEINELIKENNKTIKKE